MFIGYEKCEAGGFEFLTPTTRRNALRVLRAMQLPKPGTFCSTVKCFCILILLNQANKKGELHCFHILPYGVLQCLTLFFACFVVLLEGSPGVGKTSLIIALGKYSGHKVVRINLSEQVCDSLYEFLFVYTIPLLYII
jgi:midasin